MPASRLAHAIAAHWAASRRHPPAAVHREDVADQVQTHLAHGASVDYLRALAFYMAIDRPDWYDLSLAAGMSDAPQPERTAAPGRHRCPCRGVLAPAA